MATNGELSGSFRDAGTTEYDAAQYRLRSDQHEREQITCLSCGIVFYATSNIDVYEHFCENSHTTYFEHCLYCSGKVHRYKKRGQIKYFHNCLNCKCGDEK